MYVNVCECECMYNKGDSNAGDGVDTREVYCTVCIYFTHWYAYIYTNIHTYIYLELVNRSQS